MKQISSLANGQKAYGGSLLKTRAGRQGPRALSVKHSMHLVLRSTKAKGQWSFRRYENKIRINNLVNKFSVRYGVKVLSAANVGNHIHLHIKLSSRHTYRAFIRGLTSSIAMAITGYSRWNKPPKSWKGFWDYRPFSRIITGFRDFLNIKDYLYINRLEGFGYRRDQAEYLVKRTIKKRISTA